MPLTASLKFLESGSGPCSKQFLNILKTIMGFAQDGFEACSKRLSLVLKTAFYGSERGFQQGGKLAAGSHAINNFFANRAPFNGKDLFFPKKTLTFAEVKRRKWVYGKQAFLLPSAALRRHDNC